MSLIPADPANEADSKLSAETYEEVAIPEHCFHAFDALYCALTGSKPILPKFPDEK